MKTTISYEVEIPEGFEWTGEVRRPVIGDTYLHGDIVLTWQQSMHSTVRYPILRKSKPKRWLAVIGGQYWFVCEGAGVAYDIDTRSSIDEVRWEFGNYFRTEEEAIAARDKIKALLLGENQ